MRASFKKRLKWYGGIFLLGLLVFGVNMMQYDKVKRSYEWRQIFKCSQKHFFDKQKEANPYLSMTREPEQPKQGKFRTLLKAEQSKPMTMAEQYKQQKQQQSKPKQKHSMADDFNPRYGLSKSQIAEAEKQYQKCVDKRQVKLQEAKSKKERTEISLGIGGFLMGFTVFLSIIDFITFLFRNRKLKISTGEATAMENKKVTKIAILIFIVWGIISFLIAQSGYRHRFQIDTFLILNIPSILFMGYLWVTDKFTLK